MSRRPGCLRTVGFILCLALGGLAPNAVFAQVDTGSMAGLVTDETGAALPGATVTVTNNSTGQARTVTTSEQGRYQVTALQPSQYSVKVELSGFGTVVQPDVRVTVGSAIDVNVTMKIAALEETVTVSTLVPIVESTKTDLSNVITQDEMQSLPSRSRQYLDYTLLLPATTENASTSAQGTGLNIGGSRAKESSLLVDGFYNLDEGFAKVKQRHSEDAIQEFQIISFGGSAEYGRAIGGIINAVTKSGGNQFRGTGYGFFRNEGLNAIDFGSKSRGITEKAPFDRQQWGGTLGGPIVKDRSFFFGAYERVKEDTPYDNAVTKANAAVIGLAPEDAGNIPQFYRLNFAMGKWDHNINQDQRLQASFSMSRWTEYNMSPAAFRTRSAAYGLSATDYAYLGKWIGINMGGKLLHEVKLSYFPRFYGVEGLAKGGPPLVPEGQINLEYENNASPPRVTISSTAIFGSAALNNKIDTHPVQVLYSSTFFKNKHTFKFGADYMVSYYDYTLFSQLPGNYSFSSLANYQLGRYSQYTQSFGDPHNPRWHQYASGFFQDTWLPSSRLSINYGVRYDLEINPTHKASGTPFGNDYNNIAPRFGLSYDLTGNGHTFLKAATGIYYDRLFQNLTTFFTNLKGYEQLISGTWTPTTAGAPVYPNVFSSKPANIPAAVINSWVVPDDVRVPTSAQVVGTLEHAFSNNLAASASVVYTKTNDREYVWDTNLEFNEATGQWFRPDPTYRSLTQYRFEGKAEYFGGIFEVTGRLGQAGFNGNLTLARAYESTNNYGDRPNDQREGIEADWGPQTDTPEVRGVISGWYNVHPMVQISGSYRNRTGSAVNPVASGLDLNGDGVLGDRTPTFGRNSFRAPGNNQFDMRLTFTVPMRNGMRVQAYVESFNLFNEENVRTVNNDYGRFPEAPKTTWMQPTSWSPPREVQLGMRFTF